MSVVLVVVLLLINGGISAWDAYAAGRMWREVEGWTKAVAWAALVMASAGFLSVTAVVIGGVAAALHGISQEGFQALLGLSFLVIIFPILGSGMLITMHSWQVARQRRDALSTGVAAWNTMAQVSNTYDALTEVPSAWGVVSSFFSGSSSKSSSSDDGDGDDIGDQFMVAIVFAIAMALAGGLTMVFFKLGRRHAVAGRVLQAA